ncbi:hypothetical protein CTEN210_18554 [Chaetoceros tenuissimus]|uniref:Peptidase S1 domain-containing protein n=1 Tax=Chaetoceros tenuissimus TaxID=426638 RepID=A0AAD3DCX1_9STRA|nr:hypothetical protein CTEN210_18554 [Chaetoceros tenuissimus]
MMRLVLLLSCITLYVKCEDKAIFYAERLRPMGDRGLILEGKVTDEGTIQIEQTERKTIVNGWDTKKGLYPWYASIHRSASSQGYDKHYFYCGSSLVSEEFVLTAAHCKVEVNDVIIVGQLCYKDDNCGQTRERRRVKNTFEHPDFSNGLYGGVGFDYLLLQLDTPVLNISPVVLDNGSVSPKFHDSKVLHAIGLGVTNVAYGQKASFLQEIELLYVPEDQCQEEFKPIKLQPSTLCCHHPDQSGDSCVGDSGGPLYDRENNVLVGLTSYGESTCTSQIPSVYARISQNFSWIKSTICSNTSLDSFICSQVVVSSDINTDNNADWCKDGLDIGLLIKTDAYPSETTIHLTDLTSNKNYLQSFSLAYLAKDSNHIGNLCLPSNSNPCYRFAIIDSFGDGIDMNGEDHDYCVSVNEKVVTCNANFDGYHESVVFPNDLCEEICKPATYSLYVTTGADNSIVINVQNSDGTSLINPYTYHDLNSLQEYHFHLDLCSDKEYTFKVLDISDATFHIEDEDGNTIVSETDFDNTLTDSVQSTTFLMSRSLNRNSPPNKEMSRASHRDMCSVLSAATILLIVRLLL